MSKSCKGMLEELLKCVENTDCVQKYSLTKCLQNSFLFPRACATARDLYVSCRRGQFDMRSRVRGNKGY
ncbi:cytochrome c oxidase assembly protein, mitochondrial [Micromonas commoda]|uniref:Cytochrome c oxidase assembly protein, mitochondrial n=1 Tax=Micromonas commoda (strain RCC299 / NOUM17 / CCMP2709) TaxID=296587 RepID=C1FDG2_MICCC|nr:cytochrome c oxidase assembly protein, mitochondrial [Micromonas commoda]ACO68384.1 cytochrome c oxidase assembly protein, mitochondrial [Micromonas commoda]|eukprot:XP_002507126.1 cytochrome c oxidase assembly protein, mitochondrial [Micromonas commoda]